MTNARRIWLTRHGESIYNQKALIGGDSSLSSNGKAYAEVLPEVILSRLPKVSSTLCAKARILFPASWECVTVIRQLGTGPWMPVTPQ